MIPDNVKKLKGSFRKDRANLDQPDFDEVTKMPAAPTDLNVDGAAMWEDLCPQFISTRILQTVDLYALEQMCVLWQNHKKCARAGIPQSPSENMALKNLFSEFGMTPSSRHKVASGLKKAAKNKFSDNKSDG